MALTIKQMIGQVQKNLKTRVDYDPGRHTWSCFLLATTPKEILDGLLPYSIRAFGEWLIIADKMKVNPFNPNGKAVRNYTNCVSGSFSWARKPISIMISNSKVIHWHSCHSWAGNLPESVLCVYKDGSYNVQRVHYAGNLKRLDEILWAVGGAGMMNNFAPIEEGFSRVEWNGDVFYFQDVWRDTSHVILYFDLLGNFNVGFVTGQNYNEMVAWLKKVGADPNCVILLDGGHVTAVNMPEVKINQYQAQYYALQLG